MTRIRPDTLARNRPSLLRPVVTLVAILALVVSGFMPLAQAVAASSGTGTLLATICSPNGVRYVEIDIGVAGEELPPAPALGALDHCPGCLGGGESALLPTVVSVSPSAGGSRIAPELCDHLSAAQITAGFRPRAPPIAS